MDGVNGAGGSLPRLRDLFRRPRKDSDPSADSPELEFEYSDSDSYFNELSELYSYSEIPEFETTKEIFERNLEACVKTRQWETLNETQKKDFILVLLDRFERVKAQDRISSVRSLLYLAHGNYHPGCAHVDLECRARENIFLFLKTGVYQATIELLALEMEQGKGVYEGTKASITIADNLNLRSTLNLLYLFLEVLRREDPLDKPSQVEARKSFLKELEEAVYGEDTLTSLLFMMLLSFCNGTMPHYPVKKILLLIWKSVLAMMGGTAQLLELKKEARIAADLPPTFPENHPTRPLIFPTPNHDPQGQGGATGAAAAMATTGAGGGATAESKKLDQMLAHTAKSNGDPTRLEFRPKAREQDVEAFIESCRLKFGCFDTGNSEQDLTGLPEPIRESIRVLRQHVYIPLSDVQIQREQELEKKRALSFGTEIALPQRSSSTEKLYRILLPNLPQFIIALLKVLLAAAPTSRSRNDSLNLLVDVLPPEAPVNIIESTQVSLDINRHKEVIVKAISATLLLLLKHLKVNHVYQFEFMSQHLVFANCIPLVLKFFNQNVMQYVAARNNFETLNFPNCVISPQDAEAPTDISESSTTDMGFCWRNLYSCVNLVRILQKLTKWKHFRTVMLVVFRSAPILRRALKVRHPLIQLYILKLLKVQTKYLGRNWRRSNMKTISSIYRRVRHHLHDDWAYGNDLDAKPWDFQQQEFALKACIEHFNRTYYGEGGDGGEGGEAGGGGVAAGSEEPPFAGKLVPLDSNYLSVLGQEVHLSEAWKERYEEWLEVEVFSEQQPPRDWEAVVSSPTAFLEAKPMQT